MVFFATALIAAKPVKPCDGGVFGALNLLLKKERNTPNRAAPRLCFHARPRTWGKP